MPARLGSRAQRTLARVKRAMRRLGLALTAAVLVLGVLHAGARYIYCPSMSALLDSPCCAHAEDEDDPVASSDAPAVSSDDAGCCRSLLLGALPPATGSPSPGVPVAPFVATLPSAAAAQPTRAHPLLSRSGLPVSREGVGPPRSRAPARASLMVFLI